MQMMQGLLFALISASVILFEEMDAAFYRRLEAAAKRRISVIQSHIKTASISITRVLCCKSGMIQVICCVRKMCNTHEVHIDIHMIHALKCCENGENACDTKHLCAKDFFSEYIK